VNHFPSLLSLTLLPAFQIHHDFFSQLLMGGPQTSCWSSWWSLPFLIVSRDLSLYLSVFCWGSFLFFSSFLAILSYPHVCVARVCHPSAPRALDGANSYWEDYHPVLQESPQPFFPVFGFFCCVFVVLIVTAYTYLWGFTPHSHVLSRQFRNLIGLSGTWQPFFFF